MKKVLLILSGIVFLLCSCDQSTEAPGGDVLVTTDSSIYKYNSNGTKIFVSIRNYTTDTLYLWFSNGQPVLFINYQLGGEWVTDYLKGDPRDIGYLFSNKTYSDSVTINLGKGEYYISAKGSLTLSEFGIRNYVSNKFKIE